MEIKIGNRKMHVYHLTLLCIMLLTFVAMYSGVKFSGDDILGIIAIVGGLGMGYFGTNYGVHWAVNKYMNVNQPEGN